MKILKYLLFLILLIIIGSAIYFGTKEGTYEIEDSKKISAPIEVVFNKVDNLKSWEHWTPWKKEDPSMVFKYAEKTSGEGSSYSWDGKQSGSITTIKVIPNKEIEQELSLHTPRGERKAKIYWNFNEVADGTEVTWVIKGDHTLVDKVYYSMSDENFNSNVHQRNQLGLEGIATEVAQDMMRYTVNVDGITQYGGGYYMYTTSVAKQNEVRERMIPMMEQVEKFILRNNLNVTGKPYLLYNERDTANNTVIFSTCFPVREQVITPESSPVVCGFMDPVSAVKISLKGNYDNIPEAYKKGREYMRENGYQEDTSRRIFEVYATDTDEVPNPADWLTEIYIPIISIAEPELQGI